MSQQQPPHPAADEEPEDLNNLVQDDEVIGHAFRRSLLAILLLSALGGLAYWWQSRPERAAPEQQLTASAPEEVAATSTAPEVHFTDVTTAAGIDFTHYNGAYGDKLLPESMGGGVAFLDYDLDGDQDLLLTQSADFPFAENKRRPAPTQKLYANDGHGQFTDITAQAGLDLSFYAMGMAVGDYDGDGDPDIFLTAVGPNKMLRNDGGLFTDVTQWANLAGRDEEWSASAAFFDYDNDGDLDLFVANYVRWSEEIDFELDFRLTGIGRAYGPPQSYEGTLPYLYRNEGDGTFTDVSASAGIQISNSATGLPMAKSLGVGPVDVDGDGFIDLLVANDTVRNFFFRNLGDGTFAEEGELLGVAYDRDGNATGAMGVDVGHIRNDANLGFALANFANEMSSLYVSQDDPTFFVDESITEGIGAPSRKVLSFGLFLFDYDLDGRLDLLQANGHVESDIQQVDPSQSYAQPAQLFWNAGPDAPRGFVEVTGTGDLAQPLVGRGIAYADIDGDGDLDIAIAQTGGPARLLRNDQQLGHHWLRVQLAGAAPNTTAIGAWVEVTASDLLQRRQVMPSRSYQSQVESVLTFGLGQAESVDKITVTWPDGASTEVEGGTVDRVLRLEQD